MTGTITYILARARFRAMNGPLADERRRLAGAEPPAAYVSYDARLLAGAGWYGYRIAFKGGDRDMVRRALSMLAEYYIIRDGYEYYEGGVYVVGMLLRQRVPHYGIGGGAPTPEPDALNFTMPDGGTISLNKTGSPTVVELEYSLDRGATWTIWQPDTDGNRSITLSAGQRMYVRNTSETSTRFSTSLDDTYRFVISANTYVNGNCNSLLCKDYYDGPLEAFTFCSLFSRQPILTAPYLPSGRANGESIYRSMFYNTKLTKAAVCALRYTNHISICQSMYEECAYIEDGGTFYMGWPASYCLRWTFYNCTKLKIIRMPNLYDISSTGVLINWMQGVAPTGDFYCQAELTIPTGASGIPAGWTRHDI